MGLFSWLLGRRTSAPIATTSPIAAASARRARPAFVVIDVETTGLSPKGDRIVEIALVRVSLDGDVVDEWSTRLNPEGPVGATHIHGITQAEVDAAPLFRELAPQIAPYIAGLPLAAHNARFDLAFLRAEFSRAGWDIPWVPSYCTLEASRRYLPRLDRRRLVDCCWAADVDLVDAHSALGDARAVASLMKFYWRSVPQRSDAEFSAAVDAAGAANWPTGPSRAFAPSPAQTPNGTDSYVRHRRQRPAQPRLMAQIARLGLDDMLDEGAPEGALAYLELLIEVLEDGEISPGEARTLEDLIGVYELNFEDLERAHRALMLALAHRAVDDGHVSRAERSELAALARVLGVADDVVADVIRAADAARITRLGANLASLPAGWTGGAPLRVGDKVAFTGCDERLRMRLEDRATSLGVRVMGNVSRQTAMLVTDGEFSGTKRASADELGTRLVHPDEFAVLLDHLQPAVDVISPKQTPATADAPVLAATAVAAAVVAMAQTSRGSASPSEIRRWALANGYEVGVRGRLPREVVEAHARSMSETAGSLAR